MSHRLEPGQVHRCGTVLTSEDIYTKPSTGGRHCRVCARASVREYNRKHPRPNASRRHRPSRSRPKKDLTPPREQGEGVLPFLEAPTPCTRALAVSNGIGWEARIIRRDKRGRLATLYRSTTKFATLTEAWSHASRVLERRTA